MGITIDGKNFAKEIEQRLINEINDFRQEAGRPPGLAVIRVGDDPASGVYVKNKGKACERVGINNFNIHLDSNISENDLKNQIIKLNNDESVDGILLQLPLPFKFDKNHFLNIISPDKDADGLHPLNLGKLIKGDFGPRSCTPAGVLALLKNNHIKIAGKKAVVIGRSILVGRPMAIILESENATVTICHSHTRKLEDETKNADILVVAAGKPDLIDAELVKKNAVVIDVGIHRIPILNEVTKETTYRLCGDVKFDDVLTKASAITPVPGGVGPMTVSMLLVNTVSLWQSHCGLPSTIRDLLP